MNFCNILNHFRQGCLTNSDISSIKNRYVSANLVENKLHLYSTKVHVNNYNKQQIDKINSGEVYFESMDKINPALIKNKHTKD